MNAKCAGCSKTAYPVEQLKCLDQIWHKKCFKCTVCNMTLNMKNYKGYEKKPYCASHYPTTSFTVVSDTPENLRLAKQSKQQSQVEYHKKFEEERGHYTAVADDPETVRAKKAGKQASNIQYTADARQSAPPPQHVPAATHSPPQSPTEAKAPVSPPVPQPEQPPPIQERHKAMYDYEKADRDEISLKEGDIIINGEIVGEGWMQGTNMRTGETGMLPSNYVEKV